MSVYNHIVLGIDLHPECDITVAQKAIKLAQFYNAKLTVVHAVEYLNSYGVGQAYPGLLDIEAELLKAAKEELAKICADIGIPKDCQHVRLGSAKVVLFEMVEELHADLIVVGSHGRHGLSLLLGSTANSVLHNAACDVLAIRIQETDTIK